MTPKQIEILRAIRDGRPYTKSNRALAPLGQADLLKFTYRPNMTVESARLTTWGEIVLADIERRKS